MGNPTSPMWTVEGQLKIIPQQVTGDAVWTIAQTVATSDGPAVVVAPDGRRYEVWDMTLATTMNPPQPAPVVSPLPSPSGA